MNNVIAKLRAKKDSKKGFTLMEMLIVVAIIAILVAVSIPVFTSQLEKARDAADQANERSARAAGAVTYITEVNKAGTYIYDAGAGKLLDSKATTTDPYGQCSEHKGAYIKVTISDKGDVTTEWSNAAPNHKVESESESASS